MLPDKMFFNTGIMTFIWILDNKKSDKKKNKIQLIDASKKYKFLKRNLGEKNKELLDNHIKEINDLYEKFENNDESKIFENNYFGYVRATIDRPLIVDGKIAYDKNKKVKIDKSKRYYEKIPLNYSFKDYLKLEVEPYIKDYIHDESQKKIGYEIIPTKIFYKTKLIDEPQVIKKEILDIDTQLQKAIDNFEK